MLHTDLIGLQVSDVLLILGELGQEFVFVLVEITFSLREIFVNQSVGAVFITHIQDGFFALTALLYLPLLLLLLHDLDLLLLVAVLAVLLVLAQEGDALSSPLWFPKVGLPELGLSQDREAAQPAPDQHRQQQVDPALQYNTSVSTYHSSQAQGETAAPSLLEGEAGISSGVAGSVIDSGGGCCCYW